MKKLILCKLFLDKYIFVYIWGIGRSKEQHLFKITHSHTHTYTLWNISTNASDFLLAVLIVIGSWTCFCKGFSALGYLTSHCVHIAACTHTHTQFTHIYKHITRGHIGGFDFAYYKRETNYCSMILKKLAGRSNHLSKTWQLLLRGYVGHNTLFISYLYST